MDRMLFPQLRLCLATGVEKWKEKSVTQRYPAASFNSAPIYTFWEHQSRSLSESNRSKKRGTQKGWTFRSPFKLDIKNWLSRGPVQLSDAWIMHFFQGVIGLICSCYLTTQSFMGFYHLLYISNTTFHSCISTCFAKKAAHPHNKDFSADTLNVWHYEMDQRMIFAEASLAQHNEMNLITVLSKPSIMSTNAQIRMAVGGWLWIQTLSWLSCQQILWVFVFFFPLLLAFLHTM